MVSNGIEISTPMYDQVYVIHIHATGMKLSKTQRIIAYKLYHYNSEVKLGVNI